MTIRWRVLGLIAAALVLVGACSGDDANDARASDDSVTTTTAAIDEPAEDDTEDEDVSEPGVDPASLSLPPGIAECVADADPDAAAGEVVTDCVRAGPMADSFVELELTRFLGHLILGVRPGEGGPDGSSSEVPRGVQA